MLALIDASATLVGENPGDGAGWDVSGVGDTDGDGYADFLVGAPGYPLDVQMGASYLVTGPITGTRSLYTADAALLGEGIHSGSGQSVGRAGDLDGDGYDDLIIASPLVADTFGVLSPVGGRISLSTADARWHGESAPSQAGWGITGVGDANGDGDQDLLIGAPAQAEAGDFSGAAYLLLGPRLGEVELSSADGKILGDNDMLLGWSVAGIGDLNGDGQQDLMVGLPGAAPSLGNVGVWFGPVSGVHTYSSADISLQGAGGGDMAGCSLSGAGDTDGDGTPDLLVGAFRFTSEPDGSGAVYLVSGAGLTSGPLANAEARVDGAGDVFSVGVSVASAGDLNGDGFADILAGAHGADRDDAPAAGGLVLYGPVHGTRTTDNVDVLLTVEPASALAGGAVDGVGDVDGDGRPDLLIGSFGDDLGGPGAGAAYLVGGALLP